MLTVLTWLWGTKFALADVAKLIGGVKRNLKQPYRFVLVTDDIRRDGIEDLGVDLVPIIRDRYLLELRGCFARLRMFDPAWQKIAGVDDKLVCIDLDTVITGPLDPLFDRPEPFVIMAGGNASNPCRFNGALMMLRAGAHPDIWGEFSVDAAGKLPFYEFPDDQGWLWAKLPDAAVWTCGTETGVFVFLKPGWPETRSLNLPPGARLVTFSGSRNPEKFKHLGWIKNNWRAE